MELNKIYVGIMYLKVLSICSQHFSGGTVRLTFAWALTQRANGVGYEATAVMLILFKMILVQGTVLLQLKLIAAFFLHMVVP